VSKFVHNIDVMFTRVIVKATDKMRFEIMGSGKLMGFHITINPQTS
jgi:hypothetical protein